MLGAWTASVFLQAVRMGLRGYAEFVAAAASVGRVILIVAVIVLVSGLATGVVLTIHKGRPDHWENDVHSSSGSLFQSPGSLPLPSPRSPIHSLYSSHHVLEVNALREDPA